MGFCMHYSSVIGEVAIAEGLCLIIGNREKS